MSTETPPLIAPAPAAPSTQHIESPSRVTPGSKAWAEMSPEQRHAQLRGPENPRPAATRRRETCAKPQCRSPPRPTSSRPAPAGDTPPPANAEKIKVGKYEVSEGELAAMMDRQAADDLRKASVPPTADDYKLEISPDAKLPGNVEFKFDGTDPGLIAAKAWAHSKGLDQSAFSEMLTLYASHVAQQESALAEAARAEIAKAGVNATQRVDAMGKWIRSEVGDADAKPILATIVTDAHLRFYEKMHDRITSQGGASFSQSHRVPPDDTGIPGYEGMSFEQRRFAQDQRLTQRR
jgi:hypothetical protein